MWRRVRAHGAFLFIVVGAAVVSAVGFYRLYQELRQPDLASALPDGVLHVGIEITHPPFAATLPDGTLVGIDVDLARELAARLAVPIQFVPLGYDGLYDALSTGQVDVLIAALTIDSYRTDRVVYLAPYLNAGLVLMGRGGAGIDDMWSLSSHLLAYEYASVAQTVAGRWQRRIPPFRELRLSTANAALDAVRDGAADAALVDHVGARLYLRDHPDFAATLSEITVVPLAAAVDARRGALAYALGQAMQAIRADGALELQPMSCKSSARWRPCGQPPLPVGSRCCTAGKRPTPAHHHPSGAPCCGRRRIIVWNGWRFPLSWRACISMCCTLLTSSRPHAVLPAT
jgi:polar amino acid transport system substrate-binding protein